MEPASPRHSLSDLPAPSLAQRAAAWRPRRSLPGDAPPATGAWGRVALLIALGPVLAWGAANIEAMRVADEAAAIRLREGARLRADAERREAQAIWAAAGRTDMGAPLDALARRLPADARIVSIAQDGALTVRIATVDPDALRDALRRDAGLRGLRDAGQVREGETLIVTLKDAAQ
jgi:hypothetical protein